MRFLHILNKDMLEKRLERDAKRATLSAKAGMMHVQVELHRDDMPEEKSRNLQETAELIDYACDTARDLEATVVALYDAANIAGTERQQLQRRVAALEAENAKLKAQLKFESE